MTHQSRQLMTFLRGIYETEFSEEVCLARLCDVYEQLSDGMSVGQHLLHTSIDQLRSPMARSRNYSSQSTATDPFHSPSIVCHIPHIIMKMQIALLSLTSLLAQTAAFSPLPGISTTPEHAIRMSPLFMGRAAAVRAATKSKTDLKKAKTNALYGKKIVMAVKQGGSPSPDANKQLADVIKQAKANNVPVDVSDKDLHLHFHTCAHNRITFHRFRENPQPISKSMRSKIYFRSRIYSILAFFQFHILSSQNINRAIKKASEANVGDFAESTFEAYGFGGASMVINVLSDNPNRANADVKSTVTKRKGKMAESGSVLFMYDRKGKVDVPDAVVDEEALLDAAIEADIEDFLLEECDGEGSSTILVEPTDAAKMLDVVKEMGFEQAKMELCYISKAPVECTDEEFEANMNIIDALEELDDVDSVEHNMSN